MAALVGKKTQTEEQLRKRLKAKNGEALTVVVLDGKDLVELSAMFEEALKASPLNVVAILSYANSALITDPQKFVSIVSPYIESATSPASAALFLAKRALAYSRLGERELAIRDISDIAGVKVSDSEEESSLLALIGSNTKLANALL